VSAEGLMLRGAATAAAKGALGKPVLRVVQSAAGRQTLSDALNPELASRGYRGDAGGVRPEPRPPSAALVADVRCEAAELLRLATGLKPGNDGRLSAFRESALALAVNAECNTRADNYCSAAERSRTSNPAPPDEDDALDGAVGDGPAEDVGEEQEDSEE
jgi:hypothetical protein